MPSNDEYERERLTIQSRDQINASRASCEHGAEHVKSSRRAIARSLELLALPFSRLRGD